MRYINTTILLFIFFIGVSTPNFAQITEDFEGAFPPPGWVVFDNGVGLTHAWKRSITNSNTGIYHAYVRFENTNDLAEDWLVTPKILPSAGDNQLTFYATDEFADFYGSVYTIRVSTINQLDVNNFETVATYLESDFTTDVYTQFTVDLSEFEGIEIFVAFVLENSTGDSFLLDDVTMPALAPATALPDCDAELILPSPSQPAGVSTSLKWSAASGNPTGYQLRIGTTPGGGEFLNTINVGAVTVYNPEMDFEHNTTYYVLIIPYNGLGNAIVSNCQELTFTTEGDPNIVLDCSGPVNQTVCYDDSSIEEFTVYGNGVDQVRVTVNAGTIENNKDEIYIYDGIDDTGTLLNIDNLHGNEGILAGLSVISTQGNLFFRLISDDNNSCQSGSETAIDFTATCIDCIPPFGSTALGSCDENTGFNVEVTVSNLGDGSVVITDGTNDLLTVTEIGTYPVGPFAYGTVNLSLRSSSNINCTSLMQPVTLEGCPDLNDKCILATMLDVSPSNACANSISGRLDFATFSGEASECDDRNDVWFSFTPAISDLYVFELSNTTATALMNIFEGNCTDGLTPVVDCIALENDLTVDLIGNQTYLVRVFPENEGETTDFDLCVYASPPPPANDLCTNAIEIASDANLAGEDASYATSTDILNCNNTIGDGIWYYFTGTGLEIDISVAPNAWDAEIQLFSGADCNALNCLMVVDNNGPGGMENISSFMTTENEKYYFYVGYFNDGNHTGTFDMDFTFAVPLATELTDFRGKDTGKSNTLYWTTATERNATFHIVERSADGQKDWVELGSVKARNRSNQQYQWEDKAPLDISYYRLKSLDRGGDAQLSDIIAIEQVNESSVEVFPVPAEDWVMVQYALPEAGKVTLTLSDLLGRKLFQQEIEATKGENITDIELDTLDTGIYMLTIENETRRNVVRVVKK